MQPLATLSHRMEGRVRIRFDRKMKQKAQFFDGLEKSLKKKFPSAELRMNPRTGSVVLEDQEIDPEAIRQFAERSGMFKLQVEPTPSGNIVVSHSKKIVERIDKGIRKLTENRLDMSSSVFVVLVVHALREVAKGNLTAPSWFTALWFASTLYSRDFSAPGGEDGHAHDDGGSGDA